MLLETCWLYFVEFNFSLHVKHFHKNTREALGFSGVDACGNKMKGKKHGEFS